MKEFIEKLIGRLEESVSLTNMERMESRVGKKQTIGFGFGVRSAVRIVNELAEEYTPCTKSCTDCEAYDLVKHNCPKFCKVIKETVEEVKENYNNDWIPCSERLPQLYGKTSDVVLVCDNDDYQHMAFWCSDGKWRYCQSGMIKEPMDWIEIVAWQPLPEPYMKVGVE